MKENKNEIVRNILSLAAVITAGLMDAWCYRAFLEPNHLVSTGFSGLAQLISLLTGEAVNPGTILLILNIPAVILSARHISRRFTILSLVYVAAQSFFLHVMTFHVLLDDPMLSVLAGGVIAGGATLLTLQFDASTGGLDFISIYFAEKYNRSMWGAAFLFNAALLIILGMFEGWDSAVYSLVCAYVTTRLVDTFHVRYKQVTMQIFTKKEKEVCRYLAEDSRHGITCTPSYGGYSGEPITMITTIVSTYEVKELIKSIRKIDPDSLINEVDTRRFHGYFDQEPY